MKNKEITVSKEANGKIQYLTEILPEIPTNTILYKKLTGLGATYGELKAHRNSIIIEPNKPVISGKCKDPKHGKDNLFGVFDGVYADDIVAYMERSIKQSKHFKILTTPESFHKVQEAFEEMDMDIRYNSFLLFDECLWTYFLNVNRKPWYLPLPSSLQTHVLKNRNFRPLPSSLHSTM